MPRKITLTKNGISHTFRNAVELSYFLENDVGYIRRHLIDGRKLFGYEISIEKVEPKSYTKPPTRVVLVTPEGKSVVFPSFKDASLALGIPKQRIAYNASKGIPLGEWRFAYESTSKIVSFSNEIQSRFRKAFRDATMVEAPQGARPSRKPIAEGYISEDNNPVVCPICGAVMPFSKQADSHLKHCLAGHDYNVEFSIIKVYG